MQNNLQQFYITRNIRYFTLSFFL